MWCGGGYVWVAVCWGSVVWVGAALVVPTYPGALVTVFGPVVCGWWAFEGACVWRWGSFCGGGVGLVRRNRKSCATWRGGEGEGEGVFRAVQCLMLSFFLLIGANMVLSAERTTKLLVYCQMFQT